MKRLSCDKNCESCTYKIRNLCNGEDFKTINLSSGQINIEFRQVRESLKEALDSQYLGYTNYSGIYPLKKAVCDYENKKGLKIDTENVTITSGGRGALFLTFLACLKPGDEVLLPDPTWDAFANLVKSVNGNIKQAKYFEGEKFVPENITRSITKNTKFILVNTPENPTGRVIKEGALKEIAKIAEDYDLTIISDEVYDSFIYDGLKHVSIYKFAPERTILINAISKTYSMTGWRVGWVVANKHLIKKISPYNDLRISNPAVIAQHAALIALTSGPGFSEELVKEFEKRRNLLIENMQDLSWNAVKPEGGIFAFPDIGVNSKMFAARLYKKMKVRIGMNYGDYKTYLRIAYAWANLEEIDEAFRRIKEFLKDYKK
jgi:aspartate aminotransferase